MRAHKKRHLPHTIARQSLRGRIVLLLAGSAVLAAPLAAQESGSDGALPAAASDSAAVSPQEAGGSAGSVVTASSGQPSAGTSWFDPWRFSLDLSGRADDSSATLGMASVGAFGFDARRVLAARRGDIGTLLLQGYFTQAHSWGGAGGATNSRSRFIFRNFWFNYTALGRGRSNVRVGHFELPFGSEYLIETNGTLRQTVNARSLGLKADWGVAINGAVPGFEYEVALTRGTGQDLLPDDNPYVVSARVGTSRYRAMWAGVSALSGRIRDPRLPASSTLAGRPVQRSRLGIDFGVAWRNFTLVADLVVGEDADEAMQAFSADLAWEAYTRDLLLYAQWKRIDAGPSFAWTEHEAVTAGARYAVGRHMAFSLQVGTERSGGSQQMQSRVQFQVRYRS